MLGDRRRHPPSGIGKANGARERLLRNGTFPEEQEAWGEGDSRRMGLWAPSGSASRLKIGWLSPGLLPSQAEVCLSTSGLGGKSGRRFPPNRAAIAFLKPSRSPIQVHGPYSSLPGRQGASLDHGCGTSSSGYSALWGSRVQGVKVAPGRHQMGVRWPVQATNPMQPRVAAPARAAANRSRQRVSDRPGLGTCRREGRISVGAPH